MGLGTWDLALWLGAQRGCRLSRASLPTESCPQHFFYFLSARDQETPRRLGAGAAFSKTGRALSPVFSRKEIQDEILVARNHKLKDKKVFQRC